MDHLVHFPHSQLWFKAIGCCTWLDARELPGIDCPSCLMFVTKLKAYTELMCLYQNALRCRLRLRMHQMFEMARIQIHCGVPTDKQIK